MVPLHVFFVSEFKNNVQGFNRIVDNPVYHMFRPEELQENVVGAVVIDWKKLEDRAKYHEGLFQIPFPVKCHQEPSSPLTLLR